MKYAFLPSLLVTAVVLLSSAQAQDYPYEVPSTPSSRDRSLPTEEPLPHEAPANSGSRLPALFRVGFKLGTDYSLYFFPTSTGTSTATTGSYKGFSINGLLSLGWDLPYQPIFLELESGYKSLLLSSKASPTVNTVPLRFGVFRRFRTGPQNLLKLGLLSSLDFRFQKDSSTQESNFQIVPAWTLALAWESGGFLIQPEWTLYRIQSQNSFLSFGIHLGYRF